MTYLSTKRLRGVFKGELLFQEPLANYTTFHIGGPAEILALPASYLDLMTLIRLNLDVDLPVFIIGNGSNLLVKEGGWPGLVISLRKGFNYLQIHQEEDDGSAILKVGAGFYLPKLSQFVSRQGLGGLEFARGIPATLGGAVCLNAGNGQECIGSFVQSITLITYSREKMEVPAKDIIFGYRSCDLPVKGIISEITLKLFPQDEEEIKKKMEYFQKYRLKSQPLLSSTAGAVFKDPNGLKAAQLIEDAGLKGQRIGHAQISEVHANYIINLGSASASEVLSLMDLAQKVVYEKYRIVLKPDIKIIGQD